MKKIKAYIGCGIIVQAHPMNYYDFCEFKGFDPGQNANEPGYRMIYPDKHITPKWIPKAIFEGMHREVSKEEAEFFNGT